MVLQKPAGQQQAEAPSVLSPVIFRDCTIVAHEEGSAILLNGAAVSLHNCTVSSEGYTGVTCLPRMSELQPGASKFAIEAHGCDFMRSSTHMWLTDSVTEEDEEALLRCNYFQSVNGDFDWDPHQPSGGTIQPWRPGALVAVLNRLRPASSALSSSSSALSAPAASISSSSSASSPVPMTFSQRAQAAASILGQLQQGTASAGTAAAATISGGSSNGTYGTGAGAGAGSCGNSGDSGSRKRTRQQWMEAYELQLALLEEDLQFEGEDEWYM